MSVPNSLSVNLFAAWYQIWWSRNSPRNAKKVQVLCWRKGPGVKCAPDSSHGRNRDNGWADGETSDGCTLLDREAIGNHASSCCCFNVWAVICVIKVSNSTFAKACSALPLQSDPLRTSLCSGWRRSLCIPALSPTVGKKKKVWKYFFKENGKCLWNKASTRTSVPSDEQKQRSGRYIIVIEMWHNIYGYL